VDSFIHFYRTYIDLQFERLSLFFERIPHFCSSALMEIKTADGEKAFREAIELDSRGLH
jgi:hypothetical protein